MPRVKIDYVVSFSSESSEAPASNLLANEAGCGRWLCARGEASSSVLLQLARAVEISSVTIGAHNAALVEVLVGRSETLNEPFQVLVASSVFLSPPESRRAGEGGAGAGAGDRVRSFGGAQLAADVRARRWDRVRVVCSQPYNKHCKYGLSFIHIFSPEGEAPGPAPAAPVAPTAPAAPTAPVAPTAPAAPTAPDALKLPFAIEEADSDDEFKPGSLFAQHRASQGDSAGSTDSQIRQATSQALKTQSATSTKLVRTPISKPKGAPAPHSSGSDRQRDGLMYADEDDKPNDKIDRLVNAHKEQQAKKVADKAKDDKLKEKHKHSKEDSSKQIIDKRDHKHRKESVDKQKEKRTDDTHRHNKKEDRNITNQTSKRDRSSSKQSGDDERSNKKLKTTSDQDTSEKLYAGPESSEPHTLLSDVCFVLSGYENPRRAAVRCAALAMGARCERDWGPRATHLVCAFPNTPKLKAVRALPGGEAAIAVTAEWVERIAARRRRLPWQWFATEPRHRVARARSASGDDPPGGEGQNATEDRNEAESECDTDDEIERVIREKTRRISNDADVKSPAAGPSSSKKQIDKDDTQNCSRESDVTFVRDERIRGNVTVSDSDSDTTIPEELEDAQKDIDDIEGLPSFFEGTSFALHGTTKPLLDVQLVRRYIRAYGGEIIEPMDDEEIEVDYVLCLSGDLQNMKARGQRVRGDWVWRCHQRKRLCSPGEFALA